MNRRSRNKEVPELDVTVMINLMVVLVSFLLVNAVFSSVSVIDLNLPSGGGAGGGAKQELQLEVIIRDNALEVSNRGVGVIKRIDNNAQGYNYPFLSRVLLEIKSRYPKKDEATILSEANTSYDTLVQVMDAVRTTKIVRTGAAVPVELFPKISIGDAPTQASLK